MSVLNVVADFLIVVVGETVGHLLSSDRRELKKEKKELKEFEGDWAVVDAMIGGVRQPSFVGRRLSIKDRDYKFGEDIGRIGTTLGYTPKRLNLWGKAGAINERNIHAIYKLEGDTLTICYNLAGEDFPTAFAAPPGSQLFIAIYKREK